MSAVSSLTRSYFVLICTQKEGANGQNTHHIMLLCFQPGSTPAPPTVHCSLQKVAFGPRDTLRPTEGVSEPPGLGEDVMKGVDALLPQILHVSAPERGNPPVGNCVGAPVRDH